MELSGSLIGGILGATGGAMFGGGAGAKAGYALGTTIGGAAEGLIGQQKAKSLPLGVSDPLQVQLLQDIRQRRMALDSGSMYLPQQQNIMQQGVLAMRRGAGVTGGDIGATVSALSMINRGTGRSLNELYGSMANESTQLLGQELGLGNMMASRAFQVQAWRKQQAMAQAARAITGAQSNAAGGMGGLDFKGMDWKTMLAERAKGAMANPLAGNQPHAHPQGFLQDNPYDNWGQKLMELGKI